MRLLPNLNPTNTQLAVIDGEAYNPASATPVYRKLLRSDNVSAAPAGVGWSRVVAAKGAGAQGLG